MLLTVFSIAILKTGLQLGLGNIWVLMMNHCSSFCELVLVLALMLTFSSCIFKTAGTLNINKGDITAMARANMLCLAAATDDSFVAPK